MKDNSFSSKSWSYCGSLYCSVGHANGIIRPYQKELICQHECLNIDSHQKAYLDCDKQGGDGNNKIELDLSEDYKDLDGENVKICNLVCDIWNCVDESQCNGYMYGKYDYRRNSWV